MAVGDEMFFPGRLGKFCFSSRAVILSCTSKAPFRHLSPHIAHGLHQAPAPGRLLGQRIFWRRAELSHPPRADMWECPFRSQDEPGSLQDPGGARDIIVFYFRMLS